MKAEPPTTYRLVKEAVFWISILGFVIFVGWVLMNVDTFSIAYVGLEDGTVIQGNCDYMRGVSEDKLNDAIERICEGRSGNTTFDGLVKWRDLR